MLKIVATPIGSLHDLSPHQAEALLSADLILAENTSAFGRLLEQARALHPDQQRNQDQQVWRYAKEDEYTKTPEVLDLLRDKPETKIVLASEAGMPVVSDPGQYLLQQFRKHQLPVTCVPGPSAVQTALILAALPFSTYYFGGFLPKKPSELVQTISRNQKLQSLDNGMVSVFFVSPYRLIKALDAFTQHDPDAQIAICREMTKLHEEVLRATAAELVAVLKDRAVKGEVTLVVGRG